MKSIWTIASFWLPHWESRLQTCCQRWLWYDMMGNFMIRFTMIRHVTTTSGCFSRHWCGLHFAFCLLGFPSQTSSCYFGCSGTFYHREWALEIPETTSQNAHSFDASVESWVFWLRTQVFWCKHASNIIGNSTVHRAPCTVYIATSMLQCARKSSVFVPLMAPRSRICFGHSAFRVHHAVIMQNPFFCRKQKQKRLDRHQK